jgi:hypothetical protein
MSGFIILLKSRLSGKLLIWLLPVIGLMAYLLFGTAIFFRPGGTACMSDRDCLTETHWKQMGGFQLYTPDGERIGCWGTALAQLVYYYKLAPYGRVRYVSSRGVHIDEDLGAFRFDFPLFTRQIDSATSRASREQLARYSYYAALVVKKDFGTGRNMDLLPSSSEWERHYKAHVTQYISWRHLFPYTSGKLEKIIYAELNQRRPVYLHFSNFKDVGHSVLIDGYCYRDEHFFVHLNQGQGGPTDGWYDFYKGILKPDDGALRVIYTLAPF